MTREQFLGLHKGQVLYHSIHRNADGTPARWKVNGKMQGSVRTGSAKWSLKRGLWGYDYLRITDDLEVLCLTEEEALSKG